MSTKWNNVQKVLDSLNAAEQDIAFALRMVEKYSSGDVVKKVWTALGEVKSAKSQVRSDEEDRNFRLELAKSMRVKKGGAAC